MTHSSTSCARRGAARLGARRLVIAHHPIPPWYDADVRVFSLCGACVVVLGCTPKAPADSGSTPRSDEITIKLHNLCDSAVDYAVVAPDGSPTDADAATIAPATTIELTKAKPDRVVRRNPNGSWGGSASTDHAGGHIAFKSSCNGMVAADDPNADVAKLDGVVIPDLETIRRSGSEKADL